MGGWGSGRTNGKPIADTALILDLAWMLRTGLAKEGCKKSGTLEWKCRGTPSASASYIADMSIVGAERLELSYILRRGDERETVQQIINLCHTTPNYGGKRWWMMCPSRNIRVGKLYLPANGNRFASRKAWQLGYHVQRVPRREQIAERLFRIQRKLGCKEGLAYYPSRPKGMWKRTYKKLLAQYAELETALERELEAFSPWLNGGDK